MLHCNKPALIIAAHGSTADPRANEPFHQLAHRLAHSGKFSYVTPAFLDGDPLVTEVLEDISPNDVTQVIVVPAMTSEGYYSRTVFPQRLAENSNFSLFNVSITAAIGTHDSLAGMVARRVRMLAHRFELDPKDTTIVIVGHGTRRNPNSGTTTFNLAESVNKRVALDVVPAFIDQDPEIAIVRSKLKKPNVIVIPFLMGLGPHATDDVPEAFGLPGGPSGAFPRYADTYEGRFVCDQPLGLNSELKDLYLQVAESAIETNDPILNLAPKNVTTPHAASLNSNNNTTAVEVRS